MRYWSDEILVHKVGPLAWIPFNHSEYRTGVMVADACLEEIDRVLRLRSFGFERAIAENLRWFDRALVRAFQVPA
jgi:hypothetical protein